MSVFLQATRSGWYPAFLSSVVTTVAANTACHTVLDIGTGPGTLPEMLLLRNNRLCITGTDASLKMITTAKKRLQHKPVSLLHLPSSAPLPFTDNSFDMVTCCSVLFLLDNILRKKLLDEAVRLVKHKGKIIVLTPSGKKSAASGFADVWQYPFSAYNYSFIVWRAATTMAGRKWDNEKCLQQYAFANSLVYSRELVFNDNALLEIIIKP